MGPHCSCSLLSSIYYLNIRKLEVAVLLSLVDVVRQQGGRAVLRVDHARSSADTHTKSRVSGVAAGEKGTRLPRCVRWTVVSLHRIKTVPYRVHTRTSRFSTPQPSRIVLFLQCTSSYFIDTFRALHSRFIRASFALQRRVIYSVLMVWIKTNGEGDCGTTPLCVKTVARAHDPHRT